MLLSSAKQHKNHTIADYELFLADSADSLLQKQRLESEATKTQVNQSAMVRKALDLLFEQVDNGQLRLGLPGYEQASR